MNASYSTLKQRALASLQGKWGIAIGALVVYIIILIPLQLIPFIGSFAGLIIGGPFSVGIATFYLRLSKGENATISDIFSGFNNFVPALGTYLLMLLYIILWMLLLIIPGIIAAFSYSQVFYILSEEPHLSAGDVLRKSKKMMDGHKARYFILGLTFIGWFLLSLLTFGIGLLWLAPYYSTTMAKFYEDLRGGDVEQEVSIPNVLDAN
ncbi:MAG: hypothetical protein K0R51_2602 [Cytophagaceae bacterium]|jgi:uncharacterized membrane protein|nr:hypothetical protein [Cytophagaceae bacterium]